MSIECANPTRGTRVCCLRSIRRMDTHVHRSQSRLMYAIVILMGAEFLNQWEKIDRHGSKLPHWQQADCMQFVTFRLKDSVPQSKLNAWTAARNQWLRVHPKPWDDLLLKEYKLQFTQPFEAWLDKGYGACALRCSTNRDKLSILLMHDHCARAIFESWVIMPNHVHLLVKPKVPVPQLIKSWKGVSAREIGLGSIWQRNYRDTLIRSQAHFVAVVRYIRSNPARLAENTFSLWESDRAQAIE
jgi:hypothetical protein